MPREVDPLARQIGARIRELRREAKLTLEKLAYESEVGSKGFMSDIEAGRTRASVATLAAIAERLGVDVLDLVTFPESSVRHALIDATRAMTPSQMEHVMRHSMDKT